MDYSLEIYRNHFFFKEFIKENWFGSTRPSHFRTERYIFVLIQIFMKSHHCITINGLKMGVLLTYVYSLSISKNHMALSTSFFYGKWSYDQLLLQKTYFVILVEQQISLLSRDERTPCQVWMLNRHKCTW